MTRAPGITLRLRALCGWRRVSQVVSSAALPAKWRGATQGSRPGAPGSGAALAGGARKRGRGCAITPSSLILFVACTFAAALPLRAEQDRALELIDVPSGLAVAFHDIVRDTLGDGLTYRFRFLAPDIGGDETDFIAVSSDMEYLCNAFALARVADIGPQPNRIVISLMQEVVDFGVSSPNVVQFFESYSVENDLCIWEVF